MAETLDEIFAKTLSGLRLETGRVQQIIASSDFAFGSTAATAEKSNVLSEELGKLISASHSLTDATKRSTQAFSESSRVNASTTISDAVGRSIGAVLGAGLSPILTGLAKLFGGRDSTPELPALVPFDRPSRIEFEGGVSGAESRIFEVNRGQGDLSRRVQTQAPAQITVQVQAIDSRSFLDHREAIARAVRQAMLETNALADVIREV